VSAPDDTTHAIFDEGDLRKYRTEIPNIVDDLALSPHAYRLYGHMKRSAARTPRAGATRAPACSPSIAR
jgi:hypothetical protein